MSNIASHAPDIDLNDVERELLGKIKFNSPIDEERRASTGPAATLAKLLRNRNAIPEVRILYFTDPTRNPGGRGKSRERVFEQNGTCGDEIFAHPSFFKFLHYFIYGPQLPAPTVLAFKAAAKLSGGRLSSHDVTELMSKAKATVKAERIEPNSAAVEFHKLALEYGATVSSAESLYQAVRKVRVGVPR